MIAKSYDFKDKNISTNTLINFLGRFNENYVSTYINKHLKLIKGCKYML